MEFVNVKSQAELDKAVKNGDIPVCREGFFTAYDSATVEASKFVAVQRHAGRYGTPSVTGGVLIDVPEIKTAQDFIDFYGLEVKRDWATVYKLVDADFKSGHGAVYTPGTTTSCPDWDAYVECQVKVSEIVLLGDKIKAPSCKCVREVDEDGEPVVAEAVAA